MINDDVFGELNYELMWNKKDCFVLYGKEFSVDLFVDGSEDELPTDKQKDTYIEFNNKKAALEKEIEQKIYEYYQSVCDEYRVMYEEDADMYAPLISKADELRGFVKPQSILIPKIKDKRIVNIFFKTKWDLEMGIGIQIVNEIIEIVGVQSDIL